MAAEVTHAGHFRPHSSTSSSSIAKDKLVGHAVPLDEFTYAPWHMPGIRKLVLPAASMVRSSSSVETRWPLPSTEGSTSAPLLLSVYLGSTAPAAGQRVSQRVSQLVRWVTLAVGNVGNNGKGHDAP
jgi:hypothetical protein